MIDKPFVTLNIESLGAGVQSSTILFMSDRGDLPKLTAAIMSDTMSEPAEVYKWLEFLKREIRTIPIHIVSKGDLALDSLVVKLSKKSGKWYQKNLIPWFVKNPDGSDGFMMRKCTAEYKIREVIKKTRELVGPAEIRRWRKATKAGLNPPPLVRCWIGISADEPTRAKPSREPWIENVFPLLDRGITRDGCMEIMKSYNLPEPPRSSCVFCPYHSDAEWVRLKRTAPEDFIAAVLFERAVHKAAEKDEVTKGTLWLHAKRIPLDEVVLNGDDTFGYNCDGFCST